MTLPNGAITKDESFNMQRTGYRLTAAAALGLAVASAALAQETIPTPPETSPSTDAPLTDAPATDAPTTNAPAADEPSTSPAQADDAPLTDVVVEDKAPAAGGAEPGASDGEAAPQIEAPAGDAATAPAPDAAGAGDPAAGELTEIVRDTFDDWEVRCLASGEECFMYQLALDENDNPVAEVSLVKLPAGSGASAGATVVTPLGTLLTSGVTLQVDDGEQRQYPFNWCSQVGCFSRFGLDDGSVAAMKAGNTAQMTMASIGAPEAPITVPVSLMGFTAAYDSLTAPAPQ